MSQANLVIMILLLELQRLLKLEAKLREEVGAEAVAAKEQGEIWQP